MANEAKKELEVPSQKEVKEKDNFSNTGYTTLLTVTILGLAWIVGFSTRLFAVVRFESIIHEFDPWFNYRSTKYMVENGFYNFYNWFDKTAWYPLGRIVGGTVFPGLMITSGAIHYIFTLLNFPIHIREICVFLAPLFSGLTSIATYFLTKELWSPGAGLFAACFIAIAPGYTSRSVAGSYDNEGIAIFALQFTYFLWIRSMKKGSMFWGILCAISYYYMVSAWGGYVFITNLIPLHVLACIITGRYSRRIYVAYTTWYCIGQLMAMQIPFVGFQPIKSSEHMAAFGVFGLLQLVAAVKFLENKISRKQFFLLLVGFIGSAFIIGLIFIVLLTYAGYIAPWTGRFYSLWDTGYAKIHIPIIASVSEHQPTTWISFFFDLHVAAAVFPVGLWYCIKNVNDERLFIILYALTAVYFAGVMIRLMLTLTPCVCVLAGIGFSYTMENFLKEVKENEDEKKNKKNTEEKKTYDKVTKDPKKTVEKSKEKLGEFVEIGMNMRSIVSISMILLLVLYVVHCTWVTSNAYSHPSVVLQSHSQSGARNDMDDFREAYYWLRQNTAEDANIMSWWDYGYQIAGFSAKSTLVDNNTWNNSHIAMVGMAFSSNETFAYEIMTELDVDYVLVIFGGMVGYSGDDINKFLWMVRIAQGEHPSIIQEKNYFTERGEYSVGPDASETMKNSLMYRLSYYRFGQVKFNYNSPGGFDRTRGYQIGLTDFNLEYLEEAFTSENWLVRIYKVKKPKNKDRVKYSDMKMKFTPRGSTSNNKPGILNIKKVVVKGMRV
uniref:dolichyl-diphosphooligosaccharide--protein glycotransferase n=1 Tax=Strongyloides stercoralis TaxID=6248 RepID=A0A0K0DWV3_STRER